MKILLALCIATVSSLSMAATVGVSTHPFVSTDQAITTEFNSFHDYGSGIGITGRYFKSLNENVNLDVGIGIATEDRPVSLFAAADYMLYPDYNNQPRISIKSGIESVQIEDERWNIIGAAPTISKSIVVNGYELFPFASIPLRLGLNSDTEEYKIFPEFSFGTTAGGFSIGEYNNLIGSFEVGFDLSNGGSSVTAGLTYPLF